MRIMKNDQNPRCYSPTITALCVAKAENGRMSEESQSEVLKLQLAALEDYDPEKLRRKYQELLGVEPFAFGSKFMIRRCAHRLQELALGGLTAEELETLDYIAKHDPKVNTSLRDAPRSANDSKGVIYRKTYHGKLYEMRSLGNGRYEYDGKIYASPTAVVRVITGKSHYNGVMFWGLKKK